MNKFIKTLGLIVLVATVSFASAQQKEVDDSKKGGAKSMTKDDIKKGGGKPVVEAKEAPAKLSSHETGGPGDKGYNKEKGKGMESKGNFFSRLFGGNKKKEKKENDPNN
jgi:hypothetical protein